VALYYNIYNVTLYKALEDIFHQSDGAVKKNVDFVGGKKRYTHRENRHDNDIFGIRERTTGEVHYNNTS